MLSDSEILDLSKYLLMGCDCQILTDDGYYFVYKYNKASEKTPVSHSHVYNVAIIEAVLEILESR